MMNSAAQHVVISEEAGGFRLKQSLTLLPVWKVGVHETLEHFAMIGCKKVHKLMDYDKFPEGSWELKKLTVEGEPA